MLDELLEIVQPFRCAEIIFNSFALTAASHRDNGSRQVSDAGAIGGFQLEEPNFIDFGR